MVAKTREDWMNQALPLLKKLFKEKGYTLESKLRFACAFPSSGKTTIGRCYSEDLSEDKTNEIVITPEIKDPIEVLGIQIHEIIHSIVGIEAGHKTPFKRCATAIGLEGKMKATTIGNKLRIELKTISKTIGKYPHAELHRPPPKDHARLIKLECPKCGYVARVTKKWLDTGELICNNCNEILEISLTKIKKGTEHHVPKKNN